MSNRKQLSILISSVGRRSQLIECFRRAFHGLGIEGRIFGADICPELSPAAHLVDECFRVPRCTESSFADAIADLCHNKRISLIIPTIDTELPIYSEMRSSLREKCGTDVVISGRQAVKIAGDKERTHNWLTENQFPTVRQATPVEVLDNRGRWQFPVIVKPRNGSASIGVREVASPQLLEAMSEQDPSLVVQEMAAGAEHTVNVYVDRLGQCVCAVPHRRIETRGGEVSKGLTVRNDCLILLSRSVAERLPDAYGPLNIQCFVAADGSIRIIEINARFGGGYPLADHAGARFTQWIIEDHLDLPSTASQHWIDGLLMLRYDQAVFLQQ